MLRPILLAATLASTPALAGPATVLDAQFRQAGGTWTISVTVAHADTGWEHYADGWEVLAPDGQRLGYRELFHPHVNEQPFTRSLSGVVIPGGLTSVQVRAHDNVDGWGPPVRFDLPQ